MNRIIKFRAWDKENKKMYEDIGICGKANLPEIEKEGNFFKSVSCNTLNNGIKYFQNYVKFSLMQFTGLLDSKGREIYEGDILVSKMRGPVFFDEYQQVVKWETQEWTEEGFSTGFHLDLTGDQYEIIGNIYETPELLKEK